MAALASGGREPSPRERGLVLWPGALLPPGGFVRGVLRAALFLAGGGLSLRVLGAAWGGYWRGRAYAADSYAADLGAGDDLARFLEQHALFFDVPIPYLWLTEHAHPPSYASDDSPARRKPSKNLFQNARR